MKIRNAIIESVSIDMGARGLLTAWLFLDYGDGGHQGFGGYALYLPKDYKNHSKDGDRAGHFIFRCMEIAGVENWQNVTGKAIRVKVDDSAGGFASTIHAIGHITKEDWFAPSIDFSKPK